jgi:hypothetical protein
MHLLIYPLMQACQGSPTFSSFRVCSPLCMPLILYAIPLMRLNHLKYPTNTTTCQQLKSHIPRYLFFRDQCYLGGFVNQLEQCFGVIGGIPEPFRHRQLLRAKERRIVQFGRIAPSQITQHSHHIVTWAQSLSYLDSTSNCLQGSQHIYYIVRQSIGRHNPNVQQTFSPKSTHMKMNKQPHKKEQSSHQSNRPKPQRYYYCYYYH